MYVCYNFNFSCIANQFDTFTSALQNKNSWLCPWYYICNKIKAKMQNWPSKFQLLSFQSSNFNFGQFNPLSFKSVSIQAFH